jgi:hypothetical protein
VTRAEREAWAHFKRWIDEAMPALDGCVPVALIAMPVAGVAADGAIDVSRDGQGRIIWPATFPVEERGPLLLRLSEPYRDGTVRR